MKFTSISDKFFEQHGVCRELMSNENEKRPYLIIVKLKFNGKRQDFAIPFRSNLSNHIPKDQYFPLPPRHTTKKYKIHGLHYLKMFPVKKQYLIKFNISNDTYYVKIYSIISKKQAEIIEQAQAYLDAYQSGNIQNYATDINKIYLSLYGVTVAQEAATGLEKVQDEIAMQRYKPDTDK
ncbi:hypothetical protein [Paenibacillus alkalitolerans]|uniref:hypothetical protein n=1 Tax=Paenibacillus alkalitolerans TaxID=2799335 RepID=UPI0018F6B910|nr:hypothetical protein [Paenibacillus alkalitolerans]